MILNKQPVALGETVLCVEKVLYGNSTNSEPMFAKDTYLFISNFCSNIPESGHTFKRFITKYCIIEFYYET
jgi:hypothetical protein